MIADHDDYIATAPEELRPLLVRLRSQLARALPGAEEVIAYKMPGFRIGAGHRGLCRVQQAMRSLCIACRDQDVCRRHCGGRAQGYQDRRHILAAPADTCGAGEEARIGVEARLRGLGSGIAPGA